MTANLKYLSDKAVADLRATVPQNFGRYRSAGFADLAEDPTWDIGLGVEFDEELLSTLDLNKPKSLAAIDLENSRIVGVALRGLTPSLANEERVWVRLSHIEAFSYCRARWLDVEDDGKLSKAVEKHLFARTQTGIRDDHAISRLWWNYHIARTCLPEDVDVALRLILKSADIRSNFVERIWMTSRQPVASSVLSAMQAEPWITEEESNFRKFMKTLNRLGGGTVFEALSRIEIDEFVLNCVRVARQ